MAWEYTILHEKIDQHEETRALETVLRKTLVRTVAEATHRQSRCKAMSVRLDLFTHKKGPEYTYLTTFKCFYHSDATFEKFRGVADIFMRKLECTIGAPYEEMSVYEAQGDWRIGIQKICEDDDGRELEDIEEQFMEQFRNNLEIALIDTDFFIN